MKWQMQIRDGKASFSKAVTILPNRQFQLCVGNCTLDYVWRPEQGTFLCRVPESDNTWKVFRIRNYESTKSPDGPEVESDFILNGLIPGHSIHLQSESEPDVPGQENRKATAAAAGQTIRSPITGKVLSVPCKEGDEVKKGETLLTIEAMKMENKIFSPLNGFVKKLTVKPGDAVSSGDSLLVVKAP